MVRTLFPLRERSFLSFDDLYRQMDHVSRHIAGDEESQAADHLAPRMNLVESETSFEVTVDLPGVDSKDVNVELNDGQLTITGERKSETEESGKTFHRVERRYGTFRRVITVQVPIDEEQITAEYTNGVLRVTLPKSEEVKPKRIEVKKAD